jgi:hypothetical protein
MRVREETVRLASGGSAFVRGAVPHTFRNPSPEPVRFLLVCSPGGWEHFFRAVAAGDGDLIMAISERFGYAEVTADDAVMAALA